MEKFLNDNKLFIAIPAFVLFLCLYGIWNVGSQLYTNFDDASKKKEELQTKQDRLTRLQKEKELNKHKKQISKSGKVIHEVSGAQFTPEASFGIMFENVIANITNSGVRVRSISYNYAPVEDKIILSGVQGYNACELFFTAVGSYQQFQTFFKNIAKENYLSNLYEIYIEPFDGDKNILIAKFKIRLYTKTI